MLKCCLSLFYFELFHLNAFMLSSVSLFLHTCCYSSLRRCFPVLVIVLEVDKFSVFMDMETK